MILYGMPALMNALSMELDCALERYRMAWSENFRPFETPVSMTSAMYCPSIMALAAVNRVIFSPSPALVQRFLPLRCVLWAMTSFAAFRMLPVER